MPARWRDPSAFRADPAAMPAGRPSRKQTVALLVALALVAAAVAVASVTVRPDKARAFDLFHGSLFLQDVLGPVAVDLATGKPTLQLQGVANQVGVTGFESLQLVPLDERTLLVNQASGEFNMIDSSGFVVKHDGGGVSLTSRSGKSTSVGIAADNGEAYIERTGDEGGTDVWLVNQSTVESAINATKTHLTARASTHLPQAGSTEPGAAASADGDLWLLLGDSPQAPVHTIERLRVPANSSAGANLSVAARGTVRGAAAIGTAQESDGSTVVGVASSDRIRLFIPGSAPKTERFPAQADVRSILPVSNASGRLAFLLHGPADWSLLSVAADGSDLRAPKPLAGLPAPVTRIAPPAASGGSLYTMDRDSGALYRIGYDGTVARAGSYPLEAHEPASFPRAYVIARGARVLFNSGGHVDALMLFTDGSHAPMKVQKTSAVGVNAAGGAEALTNRKVTTGQQPQQPGKHPKPGKPKTQPVEQVSNKVNCKVADQTPHIPQITGVVPGSRTVTLTWNYPLLTNQDCEPSTYQVAIKLVSSGAPTAPGSVTVQGQVGVTVANLFPSTRYSVTVTAFINAHGTTSQPLQFTTGPEGPAAPKELRVSTDNSGNWDLAWNSCGTVKEGCVPAQSWTVTPSFCDGIGISTPPAPLTLTADPTSRAQPPAVYQGSDDLLGRGLQFQVQGTGQQGQAGTPSAKSPCVYSWAPPDLTNVRLAATKPDDVPFGQTATSTVNLDLGADPVRAVGGLGAKITFVLAGPTGQQSRTVTYTGRSTDLSASFAGIDPGAQYNASALISPPRHASVVATVPPVPVVAAATWPATLAISPQCSPQGQPAISCTLAVSFSGLASAQANGEHFSLTSDSNITCQNTSAPLSLTGFDPASGVVTANLSQLQGFYGTCTVHIWLVEDGSPPFVFGGVRSPELTHDVDLGKPTYANAGPGDFALNWSSQGGSGSFAELRYTGSLSESDLGQLTQNWTETLFAPNGTQCGTANHQPGKTDQTAAYLPVDSTCIKQFGGDSGNWTVNVKYQNSVDGTTQGPFTVAQGLQGPPPGYQPCTPTGFQAAWGQAIADGVAVTVADTSKLAGCTNWQYTLNDSTSAACTSPKDNNDPSTQPPVTIPINCGTAPDNNWTVVVQWTDPAGNQHTSDPIPVTGTPPTS